MRLCTGVSEAHYMQLPTHTYNSPTYTLQYHFYYLYLTSFYGMYVYNTLKSCIHVKVCMHTDYAWAPYMYSLVNQELKHVLIFL